MLALLGFFKISFFRHRQQRIKLAVRYLPLHLQGRLFNVLARYMGADNGIEYTSGFIAVQRHSDYAGDLRRQHGIAELQRAVRTSYFDGDTVGRVGAG